MSGIAIRIIVIVAIVYLVRFLLEVRRAMKSEAPSGERAMKEYARHPDMMVHAAALMDGRQNAVLPDVVTVAMIDDWIRWLVEDDPEHEFDFPDVMLTQAGPQAAPALLEAVRIGRIRPDGEPRSPWRVASAVLKEADPPVLLPVMLQLLDRYTPRHDPSADDPGDGYGIDVSDSGKSADDEDRWEEERALIVEVIAALGRTESIDLTLAVIRSGGFSGQWRAAHGAEEAITSGRATTEFREAVYAGVLPHVQGDAPQCDDRLPHLLLAIDRPRAIADLTTPRTLRIENPALKDALSTLSEEGIRVNHDRLLAIADHAAGESEYPWTSILRDIISQLVPHDTPRANAHVARGLESDDRYVREAASEVLLARNGLPTPRTFVSHFFADDPRLTPPARHVAAILVLDGEVLNGGFSQYFFNSYGDAWTIALAGAKAMGANQYADLLEQAAATFGPKGPSPDHEKRRRQYGRLGKAADARLDELDSAYDGSPTRLEILIARYMITNREAILASMPAD